MKWQQVDIKPVTVEADQAIADGINASLARQLANDEPKCASCKHWDREPEAGVLGRCGLAMSTVVTTDLSVCSKWAGK
jgi:hypothetical protein